MKIQNLNVETLNEKITQLENTLQEVRNVSNSRNMQINTLNSEKVKICGNFVFFLHDWFLVEFSN